MMRIKQSSNSEVLILKHSLGCASVFLLFFGVVIAACGFIPAETRGGDEFPWYIGLPVGLAFLAAGLYRKTMTIDRKARRIETCWRIPGYTFRHESRNLRDFDKVSLGTRIKRGDNRRYTVYFVALDGSSTLQLDERQVVDFVRPSAEQIAKFLGFPLHDVSSGKLIVTEADSLGSSVRGRAVTSEERSPLPEPPANLLTQIDLSQDSLAILEIPTAGCSLRPLLSIIPTCAFSGFLIWMMYDVPQTNPDTGELVIAAIALLVACSLFFVSVGYVIDGFTRRVNIRASFEQLELKSVSWLGWRTRILAANEIEDVFVNQPPKPGYQRSRGKVAIRHNGKMLQFGGHLPASEQEFLSRFLLEILRG